MAIYKYQKEIIANKIKEILSENFVKNKKYSEIRTALLNDKEFISLLSSTIADDFTIDDVSTYFQTEDICSIIDAEDIYKNFDDDELLENIDDSVIAKHLEDNGFDFDEFKTDGWEPIDHIMMACHQLSPRTIKDSSDMKKLICDEIDNQDDGKVFV